MADFVGGPEADLFEGTESEDSAAGNAGDDTLRGGAGDDILEGNAGSDFLDGGDGDDRLFAGTQTSALDVFTPPTLDRAAEVDTLIGGAGNDTIFAGYGDDVDGGADEIDVDILYISFFGATGGITADFNAPSVANGSGSIVGMDHVAWVEGSTFDDDIVMSQSGIFADPAVIYGLGGNDRLVAGSFTAWLFGGDGNDLLDGRASSNLIHIDGGSGDDTIYTDNVGYFSTDGGEGDDVIYAQGNVSGGTGNDTIYALASADNGFYLGGDGNDTIYAADQGTANVLGETGDDWLIGSVGDDIMHGGIGNDTLVGGGGINILIGGEGNDRYQLIAADFGTIIDGGSGFDTLSVAGAISLNDDFSGIERIELDGADLTLSGSQFSSGLAVSTQFSGSGSIAINLFDGSGFNASGMTVDSGSDVTFTVNGSAIADLIKANLDTVNTIIGGGGNDQIRAGNLADTINGGDGNDKLIGFYGSDILTGGAGADQFRYLFAGDSGIGAAADRITDFLSGTDRLNFALLDADPVAAGRQALTYIDTAAFSATGAAQVRYGVSGADLLVQVDLDGNGTADMEIVLQGAGTQSLTSGDFML